MTKRIILATIVAVVCSGFVIFILTNFLIGSYIEKTRWDAKLFDFYKNNKESNKIYFVGDSLQERGINVTSIEEHLKENKKLFNIYNLWWAGDTPKVRLVELSKIIESKPKIVIICPQLMWFDDVYNNKDYYPILEDRYALVCDQINLDSFTKSIYNKTELGLIQMDILHSTAYKRRLLIPSIVVPFWANLPIFLKSDMRPYGGVFFSMLEQGAAEYKDNPDANFYLFYLKAKEKDTYETAKTIQIIKSNITIKDNIQIKAFLHLIDELKSHGIKVIIITMPYNPDYLPTYGSESISNYFDIINESNCTHFNLLSFCSKSEFVDYGHTNTYGRLNITRKLGEILLQEVNNASL